ncbi:MAG TPA: hypothetical protein VKU83_12415 [Puia sp.]|nr:hypothetical protein [Puia sp.]
MRNELNEIQLIDRYLFRKLDQAECRAFEASLLVDESLAAKVEAQRIAHRLIRLYGQNEDRRRFNCIYRRLQCEESFSRRLKHIFPRHDHSDRD